MRNKELASELIVRFAAVPAYGRNLVREAALRILQMAPEEEFTVPQVANSLRELAVEWPLKEDPRMPDNWNEDYLRSICTEAAERIEQMAETIAYAREIQPTYDSMASTLKKLYGCGGCAHCNCDFDQEPCDSCRKYGDFPKWVWKGETHER